ncbi:MAG: hypothetical protein KME11_11355 [Timaviella obliquedivisa GSE-PSE-MK23-08B]|jgi:hypothetical protein|nr:hypothetical protein [Timaviella obliquedivisa GSE-PSE-MK23-08B]
MTHSNQLNAIDEQLFTEVLPEQAAIVEGGLRVQLLQLRCLEAGGGSDRVFATFNGTDTSFGATKTMRKGSVANFSQAGGSGAKVTVRLRDKSNNNASLGSFVVSGINGNSQKRTISGNGSRYEVTFTAPF